MQPIHKSCVSGTIVENDEATTRHVAVDPYQAYHDHWNALHRYAFKGPSEARLFYSDWALNIPVFGCNCKEDWSKLTDKNPPDFSSGRAFFEWGVERHNDINIRLGKGVVTIDDALMIHADQDASFPIENLIEITSVKKRARSMIQQSTKKKEACRYFTTVADLHAATLSLMKKIPPIRGVAGVPVSGMLVAPTIASLLHVPLYSMSEAQGLQRSPHGFRGSSRVEDPSLPLLIVDDTVSSGGSISRVRDRAREDGIENVIYACALSLPQNTKAVDYYGELCPEPHLLEWNLPNSGYVKWLGFQYPHGAGIVCDMDGVICHDPPRAFDETSDTDRAAYLKWLADAPLGTFLPRMYDVPVIVSWRCEYTREATEAWLRRHHIKYSRLVLWGDPKQTPAEQAMSRTWQPMDHKGRILLERDYAMIVESCEHQSRAIHEATGRPVLCWDTKEYLHPAL
jgi:hypothetical protein